MATDLSKILLDKSGGEETDLSQEVSLIKDLDITPGESLNVVRQTGQILSKASEKIGQLAIDLWHERQKQQTS